MSMYDFNKAQDWERHGVIPVGNTDAGQGLRYFDITEFIFQLNDGKYSTIARGQAKDFPTDADSLGRFIAVWETEKLSPLLGWGWDDYIGPAEGAWTAPDHNTTPRTSWRRRSDMRVYSFETNGQLSENWIRLQGSHESYGRQLARYWGNVRVSREWDENAPSVEKPKGV